MQPLVAKLEANCSAKVDFVRVDVDQPSSVELSRQFNVRSIPLFVWLDGDGKIIQQWLGSGDESRFASMLSYCATNPAP